MQELELFYLCPVNIKPLGLVGLYLRLQIIQLQIFSTAKKKFSKIALQINVLKSSYL